MTTTNPNRFAHEIAEMAIVQRRFGIMDEATYGKITAYKSKALATFERRATLLLLANDHVR